MKKFILFCLSLGLCGISFPSFAQTAAETARLNACVTKIETNANGAYDDGLQWRLHNGGLWAEQCIALARIGFGDYETGARRLYAIANASDGPNEAQKVLLLVKSANAFLLAELPDGALRALNLALTLKPNDADLLVDRARASAMLEKWSEAEADLSQAMIARGALGFALRLRAETRLQQKKYDLAEADINDALRLEPREVDNYVVRGRVREARRLGHAPD